MEKFVTFVLFFTVAVSSVKSFVFPDQLSSKSLSGIDHDDDDYDNSDSYGDYPLRYDNTRHGDNRYHGHNVGFAPTFGHHQDYDEERHRRPNYAGTLSQSQANAHSTGIDSTANAASNAQHYNNFPQSHGQAGFQGYPSNYPHHSRPNVHPGASSASSAASASSGIVNGLPVASASAAAASSGGANTASASSSSSAGSFGKPGNFQPWFIGNRMAEIEEHDDHPEHPADDDTIVIEKK